MADSPLIIAGTGSRAFRSMETTLAALTHTAGDRKDVLLYVGDCPTGGDILMRTGALYLGWLRPRVFTADWRGLGHAAGPERNSRIAGAEPKAHKGVALFGAGRNRGTLDCATRLVNAGIPVGCFCDECGPGEPRPSPCPEHSLPEVLSTWHARTEGVQPVAPAARFSALLASLARDSSPSRRRR